MRFADKVQFYLDTDGYNPKTSSYGNPKLVDEVVANVTHLGNNRSIELFGNLNVDRQTVRLMQPFNENWSYLTINGGQKHYVKLSAIKPLKIDGYIVGESNG